MVLIANSSFHLCFRHRHQARAAVIGGRESSVLLWQALHHKAAWPHQLQPLVHQRLAVHGHTRGGVRTVVRCIGCKLWCELSLFVSWLSAHVYGARQGKAEFLYYCCCMECISIDLVLCGNFKLARRCCLRRCGHPSLGARCDLLVAT